MKLDRVFVLYVLLTYCRPTSLRSFYETKQMCSFLFGAIYIYNLLKSAYQFAAYLTARVCIMKL